MKTLTKNDRSWRFLRQTIFLVIAALLASAAFNTGAEAQTTLDRIKNDKFVRIAFSNFSPISYIGPKGNLTGSSLELAIAFFKSLGIEVVDGVASEWGSLIGGLVAKRFDMIASGMQIQPKRCEQIAFGNPDVLMLMGFVVKKGNPFALNSFKDVASKKNVRIGMLSGAGQIRFADIAGIEKERHVLFPDFQTALAGLQAGRVEVVAGSIIVLNSYVALLKDENLQPIHLSEQPVDEKGVNVIAYGGMGFRKEDTDLIAAWNNWLKSAHTSGELLRITRPFGITERDIPSPNITAESICSQVK